MVTLEDYSSRLQKVLGSCASFSITSVEEFGNMVHIVVRDNIGSDIIVMLKDSRAFGKLPMPTIFQIDDVMKKYSRILLVSFTRIDADLQEAFSNMGIEFLIKPKVEDVVKKLSEMQAQYGLQVAH